MLTFVLAQGFHFPLPTYKSPSLLLSTIVPYILPSNTLGCNKSIHQSFKLLVPTPFFSAGLLNRYMPDRAALLCCQSLVPIQEMERKLSMLTSSPNTEGQGESNFLGDTIIKYTMQRIFLCIYGKIYKNHLVVFHSKQHY